MAWQVAVSLPRSVFAQVSRLNGLVLFPMIRADKREGLAPCTHRLLQAPPAEGLLLTSAHEGGVPQVSFLPPKCEMRWRWEQRTRPHPCRPIQQHPCLEELVTTCVTSVTLSCIHWSGHTWESRLFLQNLPFSTELPTQGLQQ